MGMTPPCGIIAVFMPSRPAGLRWGGYDLNPGFRCAAPWAGGNDLEDRFPAFQTAGVVGRNTTFQVVTRGHAPNGGSSSRLFL